MMTLSMINDDDYDVVDYRSFISQLFTHILIVC